MIRTGNKQDRPAMQRIVKAWPSHFVPASYPYIDADITDCQSFVWEDESGVRGFIIWTAHAFEIEMLWMGIAPDCTRQKIGTRLVEAVLAAATSQRIVSLKTSDPEAAIPNSQFDGMAFKGTIEFFAKLGFHVACRLDAYWGSANDALVLVKHIGSKHE